MITKFVHVITKFVHVITKVVRVILKVVRVISKVVHVISKAVYVITKVVQVISKVVHVITRVVHVIMKVLLSLHNPVARAARALTGRYTYTVHSVPPGRAPAQREPQGYAGLTNESCASDLESCSP